MFLMSCHSILAMSLMSCHFCRAAEITESARMDQMTVLTSEALAHVYRIVGNFEKVHWSPLSLADAPRDFVP